jgi:hypothetical protein
VTGISKVKKKSALPSKNLNIYTVFHPYIYSLPKHKAESAEIHSARLTARKKVSIQTDRQRGKKTTKNKALSRKSRHTSQHIKICKRVTRFAWTHFEELSLGTLILAYLAKRKAQLKDSCNCSVTHLNHTQHHHPKSSPTLS